jgi:hypothetical protein
LLGGGIAAAAHAPLGPLKFESADEELRAFVRVKGALQPVDVPLWYFGTLYAQMPDGTSTPLLGFQGLELARLTRQPDGAYRLSETMTTCFTDVVTGEFIDEFRNPITGQMNKVAVNAASGESYDFSTTQAKPLFGNYTEPARGLGASWVESATHVWMSYRRTYPDVWRAPASEYITFHVPRDAFRRSRTSFLPATFFSTTVLPWFRWLEMGTRPGWTLWHANGYKFRSLDELPRPFIAHLQARHPQALVTPRPRKSD